MKAVTDTKYYDEIAAEIQVCLADDSATYNPAEMAGKIDDVYMKGNLEGWENGKTVGLTEGEAQGRQAAYDEFWYDFQSNGAVKSYMRYFQGTGWSDLTFNPKYDIVATNLQAAFYGNNRITRIPVLVDASRITNSTYTNQMFYGCSSLQTLSIKVAATTPWNNNTFQTCTALKNLTIDGTIGMNNFDVHWSTKLSVASMLSILTACNKEGALVTITLPVNCIDGKTNTETYIANDTKLNTALTNARWNGYTVVFN